MSRYQHEYPWPSLATPPYCPLFPVGLQGYIPYRHRAVCWFELVVLPLLGHVKGSTWVHHLWARPYFSSWRKILTSTTKECCEQYWTSSGGSTLQRKYIYQNSYLCVFVSFKCSGPGNFNQKLTTPTSLCIKVKFNFRISAVIEVVSKTKQGRKVILKCTMILISIWYMWLDGF